MINKQLELTEEQNKCHYNSITQHKQCPNNNYCLFNNKRNQLENNIQEVKIILYSKKKELETLLLEGKGTKTKPYELNKTIKNIEKELKRLIEYRETILEKENEEYGYKK